MILIFFVLIIFFSNNGILNSQINQYEVIIQNFNDINMKKKSKNTTVKKNSKSKIKVKAKSSLLVSGDIISNSSIANEPVSKDTVTSEEIVNNIENKNVENYVDQDNNNEPKLSQTKYFSLIFKDEKTSSLDTNQMKFIEKLMLALKDFPNKHLALLSYVSGNKDAEENTKIAKLRNNYIIDYMTNNGISENRISKKGVSGLIVKENIELFKSSNITEIILIEKINFKK